ALSGEQAISPTAAKVTSPPRLGAAVAALYGKALGDADDDDPLELSGSAASVTEAPHPATDTVSRAAAGAAARWKRRNAIVDTTFVVVGRAAPLVCELREYPPVGEGLPTGSDRTLGGSDDQGIGMWHANCGDRFRDRHRSKSRKGAEHAWHTPAMPRTIHSTVTRDFDRIAPFTDAVVAVALTALVLPLLDIRIDEEGSWATFFKEYGNELGAFLYGFLIISVYWAVHQRIWGMARQSTAALLWANLLWILGIVLIPFGTVTINESGGKLPILGAQIFLIANLVTSVGLGLIIYFIANDPRVSDGSVAPQPFVWTLRYGAIWALAWLAVVVAPAAAIPWLWIPGLVMSVTSRMTLPSQKAWLREHGRPVSRPGEPSPEPPE
ncbi:MAG: potassium channel family protein, partial [Actinomycetota bacterium]|nr:potassium channel family protein [Actinomycetota bacterium]